MKYMIIIIVLLVISNIATIKELRKVTNKTKLIQLEIDYRNSLNNMEQCCTTYWQAIGTNR